MTKKLVSDSPEYPERRRIEREVEEAINTAESDIDTLETEMDAAEADIATINTSGSALHQTVSTYGSGLYLNGVDAYAEAGGNYDGDIGAMDRPWTISFWFRQWWSGKTASTNHVLFGKADALISTEGYTVRYRDDLSSGGRYDVNIGDGTNSITNLWFSLDPEDSIEDDRKVHRLDVHNDGAGSVTVYLDNDLKDADSGGLTLNPVAFDGPLTFGRDAASGASYSHIDVVAFCIQWDTTAAPTDMAVPSWKSAELDPSNFLLYDFSEGYGTESAPWPLARRDYGHFDGVNGEISIPDHASLDNANEITLEAMVRDDDPFSSRGIIRKVGQYAVNNNNLSAQEGYRSFFWDTSGTIGAREYVDAKSGQYGAFHLAATKGDFVGQTGGDYVDGAVVQYGEPISSSIDSGTGSLFIGSKAGSAYFNGVIFEVRIWSDQRLDAEVLGDYRTWHRDGDWYPSLGLQLLFDDQTGATVTDHSSNGHVATASGGFTWGTNRLTLTNAQWIPAGQIAADEVQHA